MKFRKKETFSKAERPQRPLSASDKENTDQSTTNLLTIELHDESSVPKVFYKGKEVTKKVNVSFDWQTETDEPGKLSYGITNYDFVKGKHVLNKLQRECDSYECSSNKDE